MSDVHLVAACDPIVSRAADVAPAPYIDAEAMLAESNLDFVDIVTRPERHADLIQLAASYKVPVICQKPVAPTWADVQSVFSIVKSTGIRLMIHENWRWQAWYREIDRLIRAGAIGQPLTYGFRMRKGDGIGPEPYANQSYFRSMPRFLVYELLVHHLDTARFLFGEIESVFARLCTLNPAIAGEDRALMLVAHQSGVDGTIDGHCRLDLGDQTQVLGDAWFEGEGGCLVLENSGDIRRGTQVLWRNPGSPGYRGDSVYSALRHFVDCLQSGDAFETGIDSYIHSLAAVEAVYASSSENRAVKPAEFLNGCG
jgi:predicted dehydrogenase